MVYRPTYCDLGFAKLDIDRQRRRGFCEVIYCPGKTDQQLLEISRSIIKHKQNLLLTKLEKDVFYRLNKGLPGLQYDSRARFGWLVSKPAAQSKSLVAVVCAGTSDIPVAEEAAVFLKISGNRVLKLYDVGVAGVHRLLHNLSKIRKAKVIIVVAGMEGALASLVSGLVRVPVIAVPTSCGYGANFHGLSALLTMLNSCSAGVVTVNIDNGFGAGYFANLINRL